MFIDLSHEFYDGMPGFRYKNDDGTTTQFRVEIHPFLTHAQTRPRYQGQAEFEITEMKFHTSMGTYLDAPYHRFREKRAIGDLRLEEVILDGIVIDARDCAAREAWGVRNTRGVGNARRSVPLDVRGKAVLFNFGWDKFWETPQYDAYPFLAREVIDALIERGAKLVGVDTLNIDDTRDPERPAHTRLLQNDILIVENLCNLDALSLHGKPFQFFAVPLKARGAAAMPVRAFALT
ncbi:MAG: cyclase family protein [Chloroflexi bacterium]|nr:cyclase family protein [Chloroflexota bacterium]